jgi:hypothetical protein
MLKMCTDTGDLMVITEQHIKADLFNLSRQELVEMGGSMTRLSKSRTHGTSERLSIRFCGYSGHKASSSSRLQNRSSSSPVNQAGFADAVNDLNEPPTEP